MQMIVRMKDLKFPGILIVVDVAVVAVVYKYYDAVAVTVPYYNLLSFFQQIKEI